MTAAIREEFLACYRAAAVADGTMSFARFMELALYHPQVGYYRQQRPRVGQTPGTDFYTASTSAPLVGELLAAAGATLLRARGAQPKEFTWIEIGAENDGGVLAGVAHPFAATRTVRLGESLTFAGRCVVFSNELFDAQPCRRFVRRGDTWRELGVTLRGDAFESVELAAVVAPWLPTEAPEGYLFDAPRAAAELAGQIAAQPWSGLFLALDYGKSWQALATETPAGTVRAYHRHTQSAELLARPGEQDLTCHVCWDWLSEALVQHGFAAPALESQEAFFVHHAAEAIAAIATAEAARFSSRKQALLQLLHPAHLGQKFQALHAWRACVQPGL
ncbi:MAG: SAM-dependent methyltransferase [Opitutae bacterium]|nr:SAM-dependent methyltransferase [Opitutae bacterium]